MTDGTSRYRTESRERDGFFAFSGKRVEPRIPFINPRPFHRGTGIFYFVKKKE
ncbi:hypothetical protein CHCC20331_1185 [Bacillus paralicheniformis]|nr:hypothetical protein CHCC20331_1185 [Bacillus paralicheniformis]TWK93232.1 hypothetical protein CHCC20333_2733 [Bacillus paralicheniformis]